MCNRLYDDEWHGNSREQVCCLKIIILMMLIRLRDIDGMWCGWCANGSFAAFQRCWFVVVVAAAGAFDVVRFSR